MTERLDEAAAGAGAPGIAASSYAADVRLLAELRESWPPLPPDDAGRSAATRGLADRPPSTALRIGDRYAVGLIDEPDGSFAVLPLARDEVLVTSWRVAVAGDGLSAFVAGVPLASERAIDADQTNASVVVGERAIVKWFRRVGPGTSRATTLIAHLAAVGFEEVPEPLGSIVWHRIDGPDITIAQGDAFLPGARDGWEWCVGRLERHVAHGETDCPADCDPWIGQSLGRLTARLHAALATPSGVLPDPSANADPDQVAVWRARAGATLDDALRLTAAQDADAGALLEAMAPAMRADLDGIPTDRALPVQPVHGDLHVGQVLEWSGGLAVIDFDGNPALDGEANSVRQPGERDIAQMAVSLDLVGRVVDERTAGLARPIVDEWIARTRRDFLGALDPDPVLLAAFEVEQACRELMYAARFLPRWRYAPLASLRARYGA